MSDSIEQKTEDTEFPNKLVYVLALTFVALGIINSTPLIPGWDELWRGITGIEKLKTRTFPTEWFYPFVFSLMMLLVALKTPPKSMGTYSNFMPVLLSICGITR